VTDLAALLALYGTPPPPLPPASSALRVLADARLEAVPFEDTLVATYAWGAGSGPLCLLVHGWSSKAADMAAFVRPLVRRGWRVAALDLPAHGETPGSGGRHLTSLLQMSRAVRAQAQRLGGVSVLLGHSLGAAACCYAAAASAPLPGPAAVAERLILLGLPVSLDDMTRRFLARQGVPESRHAAFRAALEDAYDTPLAAVAVARCAGDLPRPILMVHDRDDPNVPFAEAAALAARLPETTFLATAGLGHAGLLTAPAVIRAAARFVDGPPR
jgi:pimeloyl-ACP methyl ester carboxylesterase